MRIIPALVFVWAALPQIWACSCVGEPTPCVAADLVAAVFTGTVIDILDQIPSPTEGKSAIAWPLRVVRIHIGEVLSGIDLRQKEIEILTGRGGGDCGYPFKTGVDYVIYASRRPGGGLQTGICSRTRALADATEDVSWFHTVANAPAIGDIRVRTASPGNPGKAGVTIIAEGNGSRYQALTDAAGEAVFHGVQPGEYTLHSESDGDLPDDPKVQLHAKRCVDVAPFSTQLIAGRVKTKDGLPAERVEVQLRSTEDMPVASNMTDRNGDYELRIAKPGNYYVGINLNHTATRDTPYPRWYFPGTEARGLATRIDFSRKPAVRSYDFVLPDRQPERTIEGTAFGLDEQPMARILVTVIDSTPTVVAQTLTDQDGRFSVQVFTGTAYRLHAVFKPREKKLPRAPATSAVPIDIQPDDRTLSLRLKVTQPGNSLQEDLARARN